LLRLADFKFPRNTIIINKIHPHNLLCARAIAFKISS
jgi:hypothetical protein